jgi:ribosomal protein L40E
MEKFKICPICGTHNKPNMIECIKCETDLTSVKATDEDINNVDTAKSGEEYVRICECGCINPATAKKCKDCGEVISDIAPTLNKQEVVCKYVMASLDGTYVFELKEGENIVGREHGMKDYLLNKPYVSRKHAIFTLNDGKIYVENYSGTNFTFVNNQKITEKTELKVNDEISLGGNEVNGKRQDGAAYLALRNI